jgi:2-polyprenyl-3-methyl-5-hydroxy-6-metoxy-1,4-benzoquinol methylase
MLAHRTPSDDAKEPRGTVRLPGMSLWTQLGQRQLEPEIMDDPALSREQHLAALRGLERINRWSRSAAIVWPAIRELARETAGEPLRVLDLATGAGDVPIGLARRARSEGVRLEVAASDANPTALAHARQRAASSGADLRLLELDVLRDDLPSEYAVLTCSLFLHHLTDESAERLLRKMAAAARRLVVVNDLIRSRRGLVLAYLGTRLLTTSRVVHVDSGRSVRAAFTEDEVRKLADRAGLGGATIRRCWPQRFVLTWHR